MTNRIDQRFIDLKAQGKVALIPFVTAGDPQPDVTVPLMHDMVKAGADLLELGVPFSDPMADGPVIQKASERALAHGMSLRKVMTMVQEFRRDDDTTPVILMGYLNPIEVMGYEDFAQAASAAGVDGVLTVDLPPEEAEDFLAAITPHNLAPIFLLAPTSSRQRIEKICHVANGFVYYVAVKGITGSADLDVEGVRSKLNEIREVTQLPIGVGFGIKDAESARAVARIADAVIVGSALVKRVEQFAASPQQIAPAVVELLSSMRQAMDG